MQHIVFVKKSYLKKYKMQNSPSEKTDVGCRSRVVIRDSFVHPDRQVYFFASFSQDEVEEFYKYIVIDAETKKELLGGKSYHHYDNPHKK
ncbi:hypothetical protein IIM_03842 [Bacillus cereus VD107]|nr:hypothetical protein IIM_03842 [Bacillus cereus VD107]